MSCWLGLAMLLSSGIARGQDFDYSFSAATGAYQPLSGATTVASGYNWSAAKFKVPIGFAFQFNGQAFDSMAIEPNGFVKFNSFNAIIAYYSAGCKQDTNNVYSLLSYSITGTAGSKIFKLEYAGCGYDKHDAAESISWQVWLYQQDNKVEIRTGTTSYPGAIDSTGSSPTPLIGLINPMQDGTVNGLLITGSGTSPSSQPVSQGGDLYYLDFVPPAGRVYTFTPNGN
jgi:hypothetical protein